MSEQALLPCPFCGHDAVLRDDSGSAGGFYVACTFLDCFATMGEGYDRDAMPDHAYMNAEDAIYAWNTRRAPVTGGCAAPDASTSAQEQTTKGPAPSVPESEAREPTYWEANNTPLSNRLRDIAAYLGGHGPAFTRDEGIEALRAALERLGAQQPAQQAEPQFPGYRREPLNDPRCPYCVAECTCIRLTPQPEATQQQVEGI